MFAQDHEEKDPDSSPDGKKLVFSEISLRDGRSVLKIGDIDKDCGFGDTGSCWTEISPLVAEWPLHRSPECSSERADAV